MKSKQIPRLTSILYIFALLAITNTAAFLFGAKMGVSENAKIQSPINASLMVGELAALRKGEVAKIITLKEMELDSEIYLYGRHLESNHSWIFALGINTLENNRYLNSIANYRKIYPTVLGNQRFQGSDKISIDMQNNAASIKKTTEFIISKYADK